MKMNGFAPLFTLNIFCQTTGPKAAEETHYVLKALKAWFQETFLPINVFLKYFVTVMKRELDTWKHAEGYSAYVLKATASAS